MKRQRAYEGGNRFRRKAKRGRIPPNAQVMGGTFNARAHYGRSYHAGLKPRFRANRRTGGFLGIENKFYDQGLVAATLANGAECTSGEYNPSNTVALNTIVQGDGEQQRDGRKCHMSFISVKGTIATPAVVGATTLPQGFQCFVAIVLDKQCNGALLQSEDVFTNPAASVSTMGNPFRNLQFVSRYTVLKQWKCDIDCSESAYNGTNFEVSGTQNAFEMHMKLDIPVLFSGTTENISNIVDNSLNLICFITNAEMSPTLNYSSRVRFSG